MHSISIGITFEIFYNLCVKADSQSFIQDVERLWNFLGPFPKPVSNPVFIALSGLPGSGKSYFTQALLKKLPLAVLESDVPRKKMFPKPNYSWRESNRLFRNCYYIIEKLLKAGISTILDATNLSESTRKKLSNIARRTRAKFILVGMEAPPEIIKERLDRRIREPGGHSDAGWQVYKAMSSKVEKIELNHFTLDTTKNINPIINKIVKVAKG